AFSSRYLGPSTVGSALLLRGCPMPLPATDDPAAFLAGIDRSQLDDRKIDVLLVVPGGFQQHLARDDQARLFLLGRDKDDTSRLVALRVKGVIERWKQDLKQARLARAGLPINFDEPISIFDPERLKPPGAAEEELFSALVRIFPFILVMWSLAGALYPAVDL